jgi:hypothetical protein
MKIDKKYNLGEIARRIQSARTNEPGEPVAFSSFEIHSIESVLETCVDFPPFIPETDREGLIRLAVARAAEHLEIDAAQLERCIRDVEREYLRQPVKTYILASSLTISYFKALPKINIAGTTLTFSATLPKRFARDSIKAEIIRETAIEDPDRLTVLRTEVKARTNDAAVNMALDSADYLRGVWNLWLNARTSLRLQFGAEDPINKILWGPVHTLHTSEGKLVSEAFWVEPKNQQSNRLHGLTPHWRAMRKWDKWARSRIQALQYADEMKPLFARYARALDLTDYDASFSKLWGVLEHLTGAIGNYDALIRRTLFLYSPESQDFSRLILEHLRDVRNGMIHKDRTRRSMDIYLYQLKGFVETLVKFHIRSGKSFSSLSTAGQFLDLPADPKTLEAQIAERRRALRYRAPYRKVPRLG